MTFCRSNINSALSFVLAFAYLREGSLWQEVDQGEPYIVMVNLPYLLVLVVFVLMVHNVIFGFREERK